jgi:hypothetical protein
MGQYSSLKKCMQHPVIVCVPFDQRCTLALSPRRALSALRQASPEGMISSPASDQFSLPITPPLKPPNTPQHPGCVISYLPTLALSPSSALSALRQASPEGMISSPASDQFSL